MDYKNIGSFFEKIKKLLGDSQADKETIQALIYKNINHTLPLNQFEIKTGILKIKASPIIKNEIFIHKSQIIADAKIVGINIIDIK